MAKMELKFLEPHLSHSRTRVISWLLMVSRCDYEWPCPWAAGQLETRQPEVRCRGYAKPAEISGFSSLGQCGQKEWWVENNAVG